MSRPRLAARFLLNRCPHCNVRDPTLTQQWQGKTTHVLGGQNRMWSVYVCASCGGCLLATAPDAQQPATDVFPSPPTIAAELPARAQVYLTQAIESLHAPAGAVMLAASAVDAMLKAKGLKDGSLYARIEKAADEHLITDGMKDWAHKVRLDANDQRHADEDVGLPTLDDAKKTVDFAQALGTFLFVLPQRVSEGLKAASPSTDEEA